jgi:hypothetical protein
MISLRYAAVIRPDRAAQAVATPCTPLSAVNSKTTASHGIGLAPA